MLENKEWRLWANHFAKYIYMVIHEQTYFWQETWTWGPLKFGGFLIKNLLNHVFFVEDCRKVFQV